MRTYLYIALLFFATAQLRAQDTLFKTDGAEKLAKIFEVNETQVKYKLASNPEGPLYIIGKENVSRIHYANGIVENFPVIKSGSTIPGMKLDPRATDFGRNFISVNVLDMLSKTILTLGYEYTFKSGLFSLKVPVSFGLDTDGYYYENKSFGTGLDFNLYPYGQGRANFFYGPSFEYKKYKFTAEPEDIKSAYALLFQAGFLFQPTRHFNISVSAGIGYARIIREIYYYNNKGDVATRLGLNIGYKF